MHTLPQQIVSSLPHLRRYAYAVTGSQKCGDNRVRVVLETLLENPGLLRRGRNPRAELFKLFHTVLHRLAGTDIGASGSDAVEPRLLDAVARLSPRNRQILLLTVLAHFEADDVADILGVSRKVVERRLQHARDRIQRRLSARILIVEDEDVAATEMGRAVESLGHTVVGIAHTDGRAVHLARSASPELVIVDANLSQEHRKTVAEICSSTKAPVIFVGAYPRQGGPARRRRARRHVDSDALQQTIMRALPWKTALRASVGEPLSAH
jgi:DNA-directed RNA polymerase specialized sigma24 family protein